MDCLLDGTGGLGEADTAAASSAGLVAAAYRGLGTTGVKARSTLTLRDAASTAKPAPTAAPAAAAAAAASVVLPIVAATGPSEASRSAACAVDHCYRGTNSSGGRLGELGADCLSPTPSHPK